MQDQATCKGRAVSDAATLQEEQAGKSLLEHLRGSAGTRDHQHTSCPGGEGPGDGKCDILRDFEPFNRFFQP